MQQVPDAPEPSTEDREPYEFDIGEKCGKCNLVILDNWNCDKGCADKRIRGGWSKPAPRCLAAHNAEPLVFAPGMIARRGVPNATQHAASCGYSKGRDTRQEGTYN